MIEATRTSETLVLWMKIFYPRHPNCFVAERLNVNEKRPAAKKNANLSRGPKQKTQPWLHQMEISSDFSFFGQSIMRPSIVRVCVNEPSPRLLRCVRCKSRFVALWEMKKKNVENVLLEGFRHFIGEHAINSHLCSGDAHMQSIRHQISPEMAQKYKIKCKQAWSRNEIFLRSGKRASCGH